MVNKDHRRIWKNTSSEEGLDTNQGRITLSTLMEP